MIFKSSILAAAIVLLPDRLAEAKGLDLGLVKSIRARHPIHQLYRRLLDDRANPRAQRFLQSLSQECADDLTALFAVDDEILGNLTAIAIGPDCLDSKPGGCMAFTPTAEADFLTMDFTGVDFADPKYGLVAACEAVIEGGSVVQFPDFSGITCDSNGTTVIMKGVGYQDCVPASCPMDEFTDEDIAQSFDLTDSYDGCVVGGPEPPKPLCESFCSDGIGENEDTPITNDEGETTSLERFGGDASKLLTCGWIHKNQASNALFCRLEIQCCPAPSNATLSDGAAQNSTEDADPQDTVDEPNAAASAMSIVVPLASVLIIGKIIA